MLASEKRNLSSQLEAMMDLENPYKARRLFRVESVELMLTFQ